MDVTEIRRDFPILNQEGKPLVYLDNGATTQKPQAVIDRLCRYYSMENSNIHRGSYPLSSQASRMYERARETVRSWVDAEYGEEIVFTKGCTESVNLAAAAVFETYVCPGDNVIVTELEHSSNYFPWKNQCEKKCAQFRVALAQTDGSLRVEDVLDQMDSRTRLIAVTAMSNVTGFCPDVDRIIREAHKRGVLVLIDAAQAVVHRAISVRQMKCDFLCFSGHKIYGPMGIGVLYGRRMYLEEMAPYLYGGDMVVKGDRGEVSYKKSPSKYEAGTQDIAGALGLEAALLYLNRRGFEEMIQYEAELGAYLRERLEAVKGVHVIGEPAVRQPLSGRSEPQPQSGGSEPQPQSGGSEPQPQSGGSVPQLQSGGSVPPIAVFETDKLGAYDIGVLLANSGIAVRCGSHCAYPLMKRMGKESLCRVSLSFYNTKQEIEYMAERLERICGRGS
ncbi:MAG: aminotransferase class V-fold PLP-dependent enzyme [Enterocloster bolteae]|nr:aminotransferase class V-fold PLP-dependent enzyme [Enterocloster bolteae]